MYVLSLDHRAIKKDFDTQEWKIDMNVLQFTKVPYHVQSKTTSLMSTYYVSKHIFSLGKWT